MDKSKIDDKVKLVDVHRVEEAAGIESQKVVVNMKTYTYVSLFAGCVKSATAEEAEELSHCEEFFVLTPEGDWLVGGVVQPVDRS